MCDIINIRNTVIEYIKKGIDRKNMIILNIITFIGIPITILMIIMLEVNYEDTDKTFTTLAISSILILSILLYVFNISHL